MRERFIISGGSLPATLLPVGETRLTAAQAFEADMKLYEPQLKARDLHGNYAFRRFVEGSQNSISWLGRRLDIVTEEA